MVSEPELSELQQRSVALARAAFDAYNAGDFDRVLERLDPELELHASVGLINSGTFHGHEGFMTWLMQWQEAWEDFRAEPVDAEPIGDDHVLLDVHQTGRGAGSGIPVELDVYWAFEVSGERTTRAHIYADRSEAVAVIERWRAERGGG